MMSTISPFKKSKKIKERSLFNIKKSAGPLMALTVYLMFVIYKEHCHLILLHVPYFKSLFHLLAVLT